MVLDINYIDDTHVQLIGNRPLCASLPAFPVDNCLPSFIIVWTPYLWNTNTAWLTFLAGMLLSCEG